MTKLIISCFCGLLIFSSCNSPQPKKVEKKITTTFNSFTLTGNLKSYLSEKVYLNKITKQLIPI